jgi:single-stranded DNA-binding protein
MNNLNNSVQLTGRLANRYCTDKSGTKHEVTEVIVNELMMLGKVQEIK